MESTENGPQSPRTSSSTLPRPSSTPAAEEAPEPKAHAPRSKVSKGRKAPKKNAKATSPRAQFYFDPHSPGHTTQFPESLGEAAPAPAHNHPPREVGGPTPAPPSEEAAQVDPEPGAARAGPPPPQYPVRMVHFGPPPLMPPPHPMRNFFGPIMRPGPYMGMPPSAMPPMMGPMPPVGGVLGPPQMGHFIPALPPTPYFRHYILDPHNPYPMLPYHNSMVPANLPFAPFGAGPYAPSMLGPHRGVKVRIPRRKPMKTVSSSPVPEHLVQEQEQVPASEEIPMDVPVTTPEVGSEVEVGSLTEGWADLVKSEADANSHDSCTSEFGLVGECDEEVVPVARTPAKSRRMSNKKGHLKLVFDRKSEEMVKAAKGLFTKRTRTLYSWLYPSTSKREVKASVSKAWDSLPENEKAYYLAQVDGRLGIHPGLMVNPQLEGLVKHTSKTSRSVPEDGSSVEMASSDGDSDPDHFGTFDSDNEAASAVRNLLRSSEDDCASWPSQDEQLKRSRRHSDWANSLANSLGEGGSLEDAAVEAERDVDDLESELAKFRQILEDQDNLNEESYWQQMPESYSNDLLLDVM